MDFSEKLKEIRKGEGLSQEQMAEKIGVSRQAITKWETGKGLPDIENMAIIAEIFKTSIDELLSVSPTASARRTVHTSESIYDIDQTMHFDMNVGSANRLVLSSGDDEKLHVTLASTEHDDISSMFKVKFDEHRNCLDVECVNKGKMSRFEAEQSLQIEISLPRGYTDHCEVKASVVLLEIIGLELRRLEYDGDAENVIIKNSSGSLEFTGKTDYDISIDKIEGCLDVNQWRAKTLVHIPEENLVSTVNKGRKCSIEFVRDGELVSDAEVGDASGEGELSISGMFSYLVVDLV